MCLTAIFACAAWHSGRALDARQLKERAEQSTVFIFFDAVVDGSTGAPGAGESGSGVIISADGYIITAYHAVRRWHEQKDEHKVKNKLFVKIGSIHSSETLEVDVVEPTRGNKGGSDVAVLKIRRPGTYEAADFCYLAEKDLKDITAFGFPLGQELNYSQGRVVNTDGPEGRWVANIDFERGMSGGPVYDNDRGVVVGIVKGGLRDLDANRDIPTIRHITQLVRAKPMLLGIDAEENCDSAVYVSGFPWRRNPLYKDAAQSSVWQHEWRDVWRLPNGELWLAGVVNWGGGGGPIGIGKLLRSVNDGVTWHDVTSSIQSGRGEFNFGSQYVWDQVGPIQNLEFTGRLGIGGVTIEGTIAAASGIYRAEYRLFTLEDPEGLKVTWRRITPSPDRDPRYAFYNRLAFVEHEIYAVGWPGIAHAWERGATWELQKATMSYDLRAISAFGSPSNRTLWAVGRGIDDRAVIFRLEGGEWKGVPLESRKIAQPLRDVIQITKDIIIAVGEGGAIVRCDNPVERRPGCELISSKTDQTLNSISYDEARRLLWVVGDNGTILWSGNQGKNWRKLRPPQGNPIANNLVRVRSIAGRGFIVGNGIMLEQRY
jgi:hypothetical protein